MRIGYLANPRSNNGMYRGVAPMGALAHFGGHQVVLLIGDDGRPLRKPLPDVDLLYVHRFCEPGAQRLVQEAKAAGAAVVWDNDDDMGSMPRTSVTYRHFGGMAWERRLAAMQRIFQAADLVTAPSRTLAERLADWGADPVAVVENHVADECFAVERRPQTGATIGWVAGLEHAMDVQQLPIVDVLWRILEERADVRVVSIGLDLGLEHERYVHIERVRLKELTRHTVTFDVGIAPLVDTRFNQARSNIKLKEYAAAGTPWLASPVGPYRDMGERQGGRLVPDDGWYEALTHLIDKPRDRRKLAKRALKWADGERLSRHVGTWEQNFVAAIGRAG